MKKLQVTGPAILIGIPTLGRPISLDWALAFKAMNPPINYNTNMSIVRGKEIGHARSLLAKQAIEQGSKYLFFLGDDVVIPNHAIKQLIFRMEQNPKIGVIGGVYCSKCDPAAPLVFKQFGQGSYWDWKVGEFFPVQGLGMDCTIIRVDVFSQLTAPFFKTVDEDKFMEGKNEAEQWTEDLYFCRKVLEETDYEIYCEGSICCQHVDIYEGRTYELPKDSLPMRKLYIEQGRAKKLVVDAKEKMTDDPDFVHIYFGQEDWHDYRGTPDFLPFEDKTFDAIQVFSNATSTEFERVLKCASAA